MSSQQKQLRPFCVNAKEENLTEEQICQLLAWCLDAGVDNGDYVDEWVTGLKDFKDRIYFGVEQHELSTFYSSDLNYFNRVIIKFDDVPEFLGLVPELSTHKVSDLPDQSIVEPTERVEGVGVSSECTCSMKEVNVSNTSVHPLESISALCKENNLFIQFDDDGSIEVTFTKVSDDEYKIKDMNDLDKLMKAVKVLEEFKS